jgi:hypothetical protein
MPASQNSTFPTPFQQTFTFFCVLLAEICFFLFFSNIASKSRQLLITIKVYAVKNSNRSQTNYDSNVAIRTFEACCHFAPPTQTTGQNKPFQTIRFIRDAFTLHRASATNQIQREFLFNDAIASQELVSYSRLFAKLTNLLKLFSALCISPLLCLLLSC